MFRLITTKLKVLNLTVLQDTEIIQLLHIFFELIIKNKIYISLNTITKVNSESNYMFIIKCKFNKHGSKDYRLTI